MASISQRRGVYLLPNLFTTASLFFAFYSIVASMKEQYETAVIAIFIGMIADSLDGRVARLTNTQTPFGAHYDSLSDMVTFGVAPALLTYSWTLHFIGKIGWLVAFFYTASVALRLARFNTQLAVADKRYFQGLACPAGAAIVSSFVWFSSTQMGAEGRHFMIFVACLMVFIASLMVSNVRYYSFKEVDFKGRVPFIYILIIVLIFVGIAAAPASVLFFGFLLYGLSGPAHTLLRLHKVRRCRLKRKPTKKKL